MKNSLKLFNDSQIRVSWNEEEEEWYFSVVDVVGALTESADPKQYIKKMRSRDPELSLNWGTICTPVQMKGIDGKNRKIQAANTRGILRIIQSIPSPKAEPFKIWLAKIGSERLDEIADPEKAIDRAYDTYRKKGYSEQWINQRIKGIDTRKELTDEWKRSGVDGKDYAILTDDVSKAWSGMTTREYKNYKGLHKENLRDNMSNLELVLNMLAEVSTTEISKSVNPENLEQNRAVARQGGAIAKDARDKIESQTGRSAISPLNAKDLLNIEQQSKD